MSTQTCPYRQPASINKRARLFVCQCGVPGRIDKFYAEGGAETDDLDEAVVALIELENGWWTHEVLANFTDRAPVN